MTRTNAVSLFLVAVLVLAVVFAALNANELPSGVVLQLKWESSITLSLSTAVPVEPDVMACDGCSGGGSTGG